jgi:hypothetical protein
MKPKMTTEHGIAVMFAAIFLIGLGSTIRLFAVGSVVFGLLNIPVLGMLGLLVWLFWKEGNGRV